MPRMEKQLQMTVDFQSTAVKKLSSDNLKPLGLQPRVV
jgi:hypothetical protein